MDKREEMRLPPHDLEAEDAVLGSILIDGDMIKLVRLSPDDFYLEANEIIFKAMLDLKENGTPVNQITVSQNLHCKDKLAEVGGAAHLSHLIAICPTSLDCESYAEIVSRLSTSRQLIVASEQIQALGFESSPDTAASLARADAILLKLRQRGGGMKIITPEGRTQLMIDRYTQLFQNERGMALKTGLIDLDKRLGGGLFPGDLIILGARPKVGKTSMMQCISNHIALENNVLFCSAEMGWESLSDRDVAGQIGVPIETIRFGGFSGDVMGNILNQAIPFLGELKIYYIDLKQTQINTTTVYQAAHELKSRHGLSLIVIDYLGLLNDRYGNNNNDRLGYITRNLKQTALSLDVPILCAHQLSRATESRDNKRPQLSDLRDSGNIEQDADVVLFLYRESYYKKDADDVTEIMIGAQRQGTSMRGVKSLWDKEHHTYKNLAEDEGG